MAFATHKRPQVGQRSGDPVPGMQWYRSKEWPQRRRRRVRVSWPIEGATGQSYTMTEADIGFSIGAAWGALRRPRRITVRLLGVERPWWLCWSEWVYWAQHDSKGRWRRWYMVLMFDRGRTAEDADDFDPYDYGGEVDN